MRTVNVIAVCLAFAGLIACSDDDAKVNVNGNATAVSNNLKSGTWKISNYVEDTNDETANFEGYDFTFGPNNVLTATNGTNTYTGTWSVYDDDSSSDDSFDSDIDVNISFITPDEFAGLSDDWDVAARSGTELQLIDVSDDDEGTDYLTFQKN